MEVCVTNFGGRIVSIMVPDKNGLYVSPIMDCFSGEIVALEMRDNRKKELCIDTVRQLERLYPSLSGAVFHSDRGSQYTSLAFRSELSRCGIAYFSARVG